ncbi:uncharacterized protein [Lolium perenne]|uniref:uncharacterized protein n=1 Tax=Lolium perenne TaxID=4522 RepID=UPI0021F6371B|nr:uncharacterized protein LOC127345554 [Lolium perenne]
MEREGVLNGRRSAIDWFGSGTSTMERDRTRSLLGNRGSGGDRVDGGSSMERSHTRPMVGLGSGNATPPDANNAGQGHENNDIYYIWNHGRMFGGGFECGYCNLKSKGGSTRFRQHLSCLSGDVRQCPNVPRNIRDVMRNS